MLTIRCEGVVDAMGRISRGMRARALSTVGVLAAASSLILGLSGASMASAAANGGSALIYGPSVVGGASSLEATVLTQQGWTVTVVDQATWDAMTAAQFAGYQLLVLGDPQCGEGGGSTIDGAVSNESTWMPVVNGNVIVMGNDPAYHYAFGDNSAGAAAFDSGALAYAGDVPGATGLYLSLSCYGSGANPVLAGLEAGFNAVSGGSSTVGLTAAGSQALNGVTEADLSNWHSSVHTLLTAWPSDFVPFAVAGGTECLNPITTPSHVTGCTFMVGRDSNFGGGAPRALTISRSGTTLTVSWLAGDSRSPYLCTLLYGFNVPSGFTVRTGSTSCTFYGLAPLTPYGVKVAGSGGMGLAATSWAAGATKATCVRGRAVRHVVGFPAVCPAGFHQRH